MPAPQTSRTLPVPSARPRRIAVVGGGISGLSAAWAAHRADPGAEIVVLEAGAQLGGCLRHTDLGGWAGAGADAGAEASLAVRPEVRGLAAELGLEPVFPDPAQASQLYLDGAMHPMPQGTLMGVPGDPEALRGLLPAADVERVGAEVLTAPVAGDTAVGEFLAARLGDAVVDRVIDPLVGGVYAGRCRELSLAATVPALLPAAREGTSVLEAVRAVRAERSAARGANVPGTQAAHAAPVFLSFRGGISALVPALEAALRAAGVRVRTGTRVEALAPRPERRG
ncbi:protoporphyrinogen oxidase, partial [Brevibacterium sp. 5221]